MKKMITLGLAAVLAFTIAACSSSTQTSGTNGGASNHPADHKQANGNANANPTGTAAAWSPAKSIEVVVPAGAGGGWDTTARMAAKVLEEQNIIGQSMGAVNKAGGGGAVAWAGVHAKKGDNHTLFVTSPPIIFVHLNGQSQFSFRDFTPIANLITDYGSFVARADAKWNNLNELFDDMKKDPAKITVVGASAPGSMDHMQFIKVAKAAGVDIRKIKYVSIQDGGALPALLNGSVDIYSTGIAESVEQVRAGKVKVLGITSEKRLSGDGISEFKTAKEQGIDATFENWRGFFGPPGMDPNALAYYEAKFKELNTNSAWVEIRQKYGWNELFLTGEEYKAYLEKEEAALKQLLDELGLIKK
ncbi:MULTISPECIES: tripartite tricarboxylate transporter substrate binding protein [Paenibacillus]|uniref:Bug family tripartite tricarboxylate transporter substrate binding protein n=1 Tax=Paenibacillus TaxID=44249 RepID=UPI000887014F|nr:MULTISPECIES: tripartite tricarboxylate transporter substrate-binding protein [Paenibacillus]GCL70203.1 tricarboxylic transport TctC [Paenibacillus naphthalenovorans]SDH88987.1 putative tricarboxylic transport membrane protein [Paenibacillus naphthalenovorans]